MRLVRIGSVIGICILLSIVPVWAHEAREIGDFTMEFGWIIEPAYAGVMNGAEVSIQQRDGGDLPADLAVGLQAVVTFGADTITLPLQPSRETGHYIAELLPTLPGDYSFLITGTIGDLMVNETFDSADGEFSSVEPLGDIAFPSPASLEARIAALEARITALEAALAGN